MTEALKLCYKCGVLKPVSEFAVCATKKDGRQGMCRDCRREYDKQRLAKRKQKAAIARLNTPTGAEKVCAKCGRKLPIRQFIKSDINIDGYHSYCSKCRREYARNQYHVVKDRKENLTTDTEKQQ